MLQQKVLKARNPQMTANHQTKKEKIFWKNIFKNIKLNQKIREQFQKDNSEKEIVQIEPEVAEQPLFNETHTLKIMELNFNKEAQNQ